MACSSKYEKVMVYLITGKAGAGKSHYALELINEFKTIEPRPTVFWIDGDNFRAEMGNQDFSEEGRKRNLLNAAEKAARLEDEGFIVVCSFVAPKKQWREEMREYWKESLLIYIPGGKLWEGTTYESPTMDELTYRSWQE